MRLVIPSVFIICYLETISAVYLNLREPVDLTWPFDNDTLYWKDGQTFKFTKQEAGHRADGVWYAVNEFCAAEHGGTHFDAPYHFYEQGWKVGDVPLQNLIANGMTVDLVDETKHHKNEMVLLPRHLEKWLVTYGKIPRNTVLLVKFGWAQYYYNRNKYFGINDEGHYNFPGISAAAAEWIVENGNIVGVGVDTPSVDPGKNGTYQVHEILSKHQIYCLENVKIPETFPGTDFKIHVMPMKIAEGTGAPLRLFAIPT